MTEISAVNSFLATEFVRLHSDNDFGVVTDMKVDPARIKERLTALGISASEAERRSRNYRGMINQILADKARMPAADRLQRLARSLDCDVDYLLGNQIESRRVNQNPDNSGSTSGMPEFPGLRHAVDYVSLPKVPLIGRAGAGVFVKSDEDVDDYVMVEGGRHPKFPKARHFAVTVEGDSMNDMGRDSLFDGDIAFCVAWADTGYAPMDDYLVVVQQRIAGGHVKEQTIKAVKHVEGGIQLEPRSTNKKHKPIFVPYKESDDGHEIEIIGLVYGKNSIFSRRI